MKNNKIFGYVLTGVLSWEFSEMEGIPSSQQRHRVQKKL